MGGTGRAPRSPGDAESPRFGTADAEWMAEAVVAAEPVQGRTAPNPGVGAVVVPPGAGSSGVGSPGVGSSGAGAARGGATAPIAVFRGATSPPGGPHAEIVALRAAGPAARGSTLYVTLEPCAHHGRTPPCADAIVAAGVARVVVALADPDARVDGTGIAALRSAGVEVAVGPGADAARRQLAPYLKHRRTGRPWVVLKLAASLDGGTAAPDGSSRWITGPQARADVHRLRARSDAVVVGAGTVRADDPELTVRLPPDDPYFRSADQQPLRVVLGSVPPGAAVAPALELGGSPDEILDELGGRGVLQILVEGGAAVAHAFHHAGVVDRYVLYLAPALFGGRDARPLFDGPGAPTIDDLWRGRLHSVTSLGEDLRVELSVGDA